MNAFQLALVVLVAVLVGAALPVLIQLRATLRTTGGVLQTRGEQLGHVLEEVTADSARVGALAESAQRLSQKLRLPAALGAALAPVILAAVNRARSPAGPVAIERRTPMSGQDDRMTKGEREGFGGGQMLLAFAGGALAGAIAGLLLAPRSGAETRANVRDLADRTREKLAQVPNAIHEAGAAAAAAAKEALADEKAARHHH